jgi:hypothetical protein
MIGPAHEWFEFPHPFARKKREDGAPNLIVFEPDLAAGAKEFVESKVSNARLGEPVHFRLVIDRSPVCVQSLLICIANSRVRHPPIVPQLGFPRSKTDGFLGS